MLLNISLLIYFLINIFNILSSFVLYKPHSILNFDALVNKMKCHLRARIIKRIIRFLLFHINTWIFVDINDLIFDIFFDISHSNCRCFCILYQKTYKYQLKWLPSNSRLHHLLDIYHPYMIQIVYLTKKSLEYAKIAFLANPLPSLICIFCNVLSLWDEIKDILIWSFSLWLNYLSYLSISFL